MVATSIYLSPLPLPSTFNAKSRYFLNAQSRSPTILSPLALPAILPLTRNNHSHSHSIPLKTTQIWRTHAFPSEAFLLLEVENSEQIVATTDDGVSTIISVLLLVAFIGLSILTIGVIYIAVADFLQKREREKFEKEEATKIKKGAKKRKARARSGPRGFGQKIDDDDDV